MEKEIIEITKQREDQEGLLTKLFFHNGMLMKESEENNQKRRVYELEVITMKHKLGKDEFYETTVFVPNRDTNQLKMIYASERKDTREEGISSHFEAINHFKTEYLIFEVLMY